MLRLIIVGGDKMKAENIHSHSELLNMLDAMLRDPEPFWNDFYSDRDKNIPFFVDYPDENLVSYFTNNLLNTGKALELGCGNGRNAIYFTKNGCEVDAVDISSESIKWAKELSVKHNVSVNFINQSVYNLVIEESTYDIIYDSGCMHHIPPHRRIGYIEMITKALKPGGHFGITCFRPGFEKVGGGSSITDYEVYQLGSLKGGLAYTEEKLHELFHAFEVIEMRPMKEKTPEDKVFGKEIVWAALFKKPHDK